MKRIAQIMVMALGLAHGWVQAGTTALGFEIGTTTVEQFKSALPKKTKMVDQGPNTMSNGDQYQVEGAPFELDGLRDVTVVFDAQKKLAAIFLNMDKSRFDSVFAAVSKKYTVSVQQRPFVGNKYARFNTPDSVIEINAPHLSFDMSVQYMRNDMFRKATAEVAAEAAAKKKREAGKF